MKRILIFALFMATSCLFLSAQTASKEAIAGSWKGSFADSVGSGTLYVTLKQGSGGDISGNYNASSRGSGTIAGDLHAGTLEFILTQQVPGCMGSYTGKLTMNGSSASGTFWGDDCNGKHSNGVISLTLASSEIPSSAQPSNAPATSTNEYVPCMAPSVFLFEKPAPGKHIEELKEGSPVVVEEHDGDWFKVKAQSGNIGYINKDWMCKKTDYEARMSNSPASSTPTDSTTTTQQQPSQPTGIPPGTMLAVAWRAQPWTTTTYYQQPGSSSTNCTGSGSWLGPFWNGSASCTSVYSPAQNIPITWTRYTVYNLVETANSWMVLSCTKNWAFSQCRYLVPGESFPFRIVKGQALVTGQKTVKFNIVASQPKTNR
jgi:hypothetical protein